MKANTKKLALRHEILQRLDASSLRAMDGRGLTFLIPQVRPAEPTEGCVSCIHPEIIVKIATVDIPVDLSYVQGG